MIGSFTEFFFAILKNIGELIYENRIANLISKSLMYLFLILSIVIIIYTLVKIHNEEERNYIFNSILPFTVAPAIGLSAFYTAYKTSIFSNSLDSQLEKIREERVNITNKIEKEDKLDIFHTIQLSLNQLNEYYTINKSQAKSSFRFSIFSIVLGLITIICGVWINYFGKSNIEISFITAISGVILEFIGGAYFFMYKKSLEQVNYFFSQLIKIQDTMLSINMANNITNEEKKTEISERIIISLLERSLK